MFLMRSNQGDMRIGVGTRCHTRTWDTENPGYGNALQDQRGWRPRTRLVRCGNGFKVPAGLVDADDCIAHARSMTARQQPGGKGGQGGKSGVTHNGV